MNRRISAAFRRAVAQARRTDDPAGIVNDAAPPCNGGRRLHMSALACEEVAVCIAKVQGRGSARAIGS